MLLYAHPSDHAASSENKIVWNMKSSVVVLVLLWLLYLLPKKSTERLRSELIINFDHADLSDLTREVRHPRLLLYEVPALALEDIKKDDLSAHSSMK